MSTTSKTQSDGVDGPENCNISIRRGRKKRGYTRGIAVEKARKRLNNRRLPVSFDSELRQAFGTYSVKFNNECGYIARNFLPLDVEDWRRIPHNKKEVLYHRLEENFEIDTSSKLVQDVIDLQMNRSWRQFKWHMHKFFKKIGGETDYEAAKSQKPARIRDQSTWDKLCDIWGKKTKKDLCNKNVENRSKSPLKSTTGLIPTPNPHIHHGPSLLDPTGAIETFRKSNHSEEHGWKNESARIAYEAMRQIRQEHGYKPDNQNPMTDLDIMELVLGRQSCSREGWSGTQWKAIPDTGGSQLDPDSQSQGHSSNNRPSHLGNPNPIDQGLSRIERDDRPDPVDQRLSCVRDHHPDPIHQRLSRLEYLFSQFQSQAKQSQLELDVQVDRIARLDELFSQFMANRQKDISRVMVRVTRLEEMFATFMERSMIVDVAPPVTRLEEMFAAFMERSVADFARPATRSTKQQLRN